MQWPITFVIFNFEYSGTLSYCRFIYQAFVILIFLYTLNILYFDFFSNIFMFIEIPWINWRLSLLSSNEVHCCQRWPFKKLLVLQISEDGSDRLIAMCLPVANSSYVFGPKSKIHLIYNIGSIKRAWSLDCCQLGPCWINANI